MIFHHHRRSARRALVLIPLVFAGMSIAALPGLAEAVKSSVTVRASQLAHAGYEDKAVQLLQDALVAHPEDLEIRLALANIYAENRQYDKAETEFRKALRSHPNSSAAEIALGRFYLTMGSLSVAERVLDEAVRNHPKLGNAHALLALVLARERKYAEAQAHLRLVSPPTNSDERIRYFRLAASIRSGLGDSQGAAHFMEKALQAAPADEELQLITGLTEADAGEWKSCIKNIAPLYRSNPTPDSGLLLLRAQLATHEEFTLTLQSIRELDLPRAKKLELRIRCAQMLAEAEQHSEAIEVIEEALITEGGTDDFLRYSLAVEQYNAAKFDEALATLNSLPTKNTSAEIEDLLGDLEEQKGDIPAAIHSHEKAVELAPQEERYRLSLGAQLLKFQNYAAAVSVFQQAAELFPNSARIFVGLGMAYYFLEKYDNSVSAFLQADKLDSQSGRAIRYLGATQLESADGPTPAAIGAVCGSPGSEREQSLMATWCSALLFRKAYLGGNKAAVSDIIQKLRVANSFAPDDPVASCSLGQAFQWTEQLADARHWLEICVRLRPNSAEDHYRLSRVYRELGLTKAAAEQAQLTDRSNEEKALQSDMAKQFAQEVLGESKSPTSFRVDRP